MEGRSSGRRRQRESPNNGEEEGMTMIAFSDLLRDAAGAAGDLFTELADSAPEAFAAAASSVGEGGAAARSAFMDAADGAADALLSWASSVRDGSGGFVDPTVLMAGLEGKDMIPSLVGVIYLEFLLLARVIVVICRRIGVKRRRAQRRHRRQMRGKGPLTKLWSVRTSLSGEVWEADSVGSVDIDEVDSQQQQSRGGFFFSARGGTSLVSLPSLRRGLSGKNISASSLPANGDQAASGEGEVQQSAETAEAAAAPAPQMARPLPPLQILGPSVTSLEYITSQPPPEVPSIFATARYRSIHRKLILDIRRLTLGRCNPLSHPEVDVSDRSRDGAAAAHSGDGTTSPRKTRLLISEMASRGGGDDAVKAKKKSHKVAAIKTTTNRSGESREVSFEAQLAVKQTFGPPKLIPVSSVLNASATPPTGCGALELTFDVSDQRLEKQLIEDLTDPNKAISHIIAVESHQRELVKDIIADDYDKGVDERPEHDEDEDVMQPLTESGMGVPTVVTKDNCGKKGKADVPIKTVTEEYTFDSARDAAEFQSVVLALRLIGTEIRNMYSSLELLHMSSEAFDGDEVVLHAPSKPFGDSKADGEGAEDGDKTMEEHIRPAHPGIALDDVYRCLGEIPSIRKNLERFYRYHYPVDLQHHWDESEHGIDALGAQHLLSNAAEQDGDDVEDGKEISTATYGKKRLLLGVVDFLRLFLPPPEAGAAPRPNPSAARNVGEAVDDGGIDAHKQRVVSAVTIRKRVARAALRVQFYVNATKIVRAGWTVPIPPTNNASEKDNDAGSRQYRRRLAFDDDIENIRRDCFNKNEYYEATVGRDVKCKVHDCRHLIKKGSSRPSGYQGFSLVGCHVFELPEEEGSDADKAHPLQPHNDPILALPSLRKIIEAHPEQDFFVHAFFSGKRRRALVMLFVRTLPRGVDEKFDNIIDNFVSGDPGVRDRKLEVFLQLGPGSELPGSIWVALKMINWMLRFARKGESDIPVLSNTVRTPFPGMRLSSYAATHHFGGSLQTNENLPKNYVAATAKLDEGTLQNPILKGLYSNLDEGGLRHCVVDATLVLEGQNADELPERALSTIRLVHLNAVKSALPISFSSTGTVARGEHECSPTHRSSSLLQGLTQSTLNMFGMGRQVLDEESRISGQGYEDALSDADSVDPYKRDLDALEEILDGVTVPVRKANLSAKEMVAISAMQGGEDSSADEAARIGQDPRSPRTADGFKIEKNELATVPVLQTLSRKDLTRYYLASYGDLKATAVRVVESAGWRGLTFPIDTRACRIELRSNQFVQFGEDIEGNPVFYFRNVCLGPWRKDVDATTLAVLHRLEAAMKQITVRKPAAKCTVIVLMGKPLLEDPMKRRSSDVGGAVDDDDAEADTEEKADENDKKVEKEEEKKDDKEAKTRKKQMERNPFFIGSDPRIDTSETYFVHTNSALIQRLVQVLSTHYPQRLAKALIVPSSGWEKTVGGLSLRANVPSPRTRSKITMLNSASDLKDYIDEDYLLSFAGGKAVLPPQAFE